MSCRCMPFLAHLRVARAAAESKRLCAAGSVIIIVIISSSCCIIIIDMIILFTIIAIVICIQYDCYTTNGNNAIMYVCVYIYIYI